MEIHTIEVVPAGLEFKCDEETPILQAANQAGLVLPYGCRKGNCGTCKAQVLDGEVDLETESTYSLSQFEQDQGFTLLCSAYAVSDLVLEIDVDVEELTAPSTASDINGEVVEVTALTHDIRRLRIALEAPLEFRAGQFAQVNAPGTDVWRSYSMANPPSRPSEAEFMIKVVPGGEFSSRLETLTLGTPIRLNGPHGQFSVRDHDRPLLLVGGGAGMAPLWSILQDLAERRDPRPVRFFYGARSARDLFHLDELSAIGAQLADFQLVTALSEPAGSEADGHETGLVTDVVRRRLGREIADHGAYLCGPPPMIDATLVLLEAHGLRERKTIFYDKFSPS